MHGRSLRILQPCSSHAPAAGWVVNAWLKREDPAIKTSMDFHCQPWTLSLIAIISVLFATGLALVAPQDWDLGQKLQLAVCYLTVVGSLILFFFFFFGSLILIKCLL